MQCSTGRRRHATARVHLMLAAAAAALWPVASLAETFVVARTGEAVPEGNGTFSAFSAPALNANGQVAFTATLAGTSGGVNDNTGVYLHNGVLENRARENTPVPEGNGSFAGFNFNNPPVLNAAGQMAFYADLRGTAGATLDDSGIYVHTGSALLNRARENAAVPQGNGSFSSLGVPLFNDAGQAVFHAFLRNTTGGFIDDSGIFMHTGTGLATRARENAAVPEGNGSFDNFGNPVLNSLGQVAFSALLRGTTGGAVDDSGVYLHTGNVLTNRVRENAAAPGGNGAFSTFSGTSVVLNSAGQIAFSATLRNTSGGANDDEGLYLHDGAVLKKVARENEAVPEGNGAFSSFGQNGQYAALNRAGQVAFTATLKNTSAGSLNDGGVYLHNGSALVNIARENSAAPDGNGVLSFLGVPILNSTGQVAFRASVRNAGGSAADGEPVPEDGAIYLADEREQLTVVRKGQTLAGRTVSSVLLAEGGRGEDGRATSLNDFGQLAYQASFTDGTQAVVLFTPDLRWRSSTGGDWDDLVNWTVGLRPSTRHQVKIDPAASLTVRGPASAESVRSLEVGGGTGIATLALQLGGSINSPFGPVVIQPTGVLTGDGSIIGTVNNNGGTVLADNLTITSGGLNNSGVITGDGRINASVFNFPAGEVRVGAGQRIRFTGQYNENAGRIEVIGGEVEFDGLLVNGPSGFIVGRNAMMRFDGGVTNDGDIAFSFGTSDVFGNLTNNAGGAVILSGNSNTTFYDNLVVSSGSEFRVSNGSTGVFFGQVGGTGNFTGGGTKFFEGGSSASIGNLASSGITVVGAGATLAANHIRESSLSVDGRAQVRPNGSPAGTSRVSHLSISSGGRLDLANNDLIVDYSGASPIGDVAGFLARGYNGGAWDGDGIHSSLGNGSSFALGYAEASAIFSSFPATFSGQSVDATTVLIAFTRYGDANLDGVVNLQDFNRLAANFGATGAVWSRGDFNYDGAVNLQDFNRLAANFGLSAAGAEVTPGDWAALATAVPEPLAPALVAALPLLLRRRNLRR